MSSLGSLRASDEGDPSPLMMDRSVGIFHNEGSDRDDIEKKEQSEKEEARARDATAASNVGSTATSTPSPSSRLSSAKTTRETTAASSPMQPINTSQNKLLAARQGSRSSLRLNQSSRKSMFSACTTRESRSTMFSPLEEDRDDLLLQNLSNADKEVKEALERYDSILPNCSTYQDALKREALEELSEVLSNAHNAWSSSDSASYDELEKEVFLKITAAKEVCEIEDSKKAVQMEDSEEAIHSFQDGDIESNDLAYQRVARAAQQLEDCQRIKHKILSTVVPLNHYDPLHFIILANTTVTDGVQFPIFLPWAFGFKTSDCVKAGLAANLVSALAASPSLQSKLLTCFPRFSHGAIRKMDAVTRQFIDIPYVAYYVPGWYALNLGPVSRIAFCFIGPSALARRATSRFFQSEFYRGSLEQRAKALTSRDPRMTSTQLAFKDALERFGPDIIAAITRSFFSNLYDYHQGTISAEEVYTKTRWSASVYTMATIGFYAFYRVLEAVIIRTQMKTAGSYQDFARADAQKVEHLKTSLSDLEPSSSSSRSLLDSPTQHNRVISTIEHLTDVRMDALSHALKFLDSPVTNLMGDPLYRWSFGNDKKAIDSFRVLDALKFLRTILPSLRSEDVQEQQQAYAAFTNLKNYLITNVASGDIESGINRSTVLQNSPAAFSRFSNDEYDSISQNKIDALIEFFKTFSDPAPYKPPGSLLGATRRPSYQAIGQNENEL